MEPMTQREYLGDQQDIELTDQKEDTNFEASEVTSATETANSPVTLHARDLREDETKQVPPMPPDVRIKIQQEVLKSLKVRNSISYISADCVMCIAFSSLNAHH